MNRNAANAVLKILEEPPPNAVLLIVAHAPGRLLPTIRSRCRRLALQPLADETVIALLGDYAPNTSPDERAALARLAEGSIGRALELASAGSLALYREMVEVLVDPARARHAAPARLRRALRAARRGGQCRLALAQLPVRRLAERTVARSGAVASGDRAGGSRRARIAAEIAGRGEP